MQLSRQKLTIVNRGVANFVGVYGRSVLVAMHKSVVGHFSGKRTRYIASLQFTIGLQGQPICRPPRETPSPRYSVHLPACYAPTKITSRLANPINRVRLALKCQPSSRIYSSVSALHAFAKPLSSPEIVKPHFCSTRSEAALSLATRA